MTERANIRRLQGLEQIDREKLPFDPTRDISEEEWDKMRRYVGRLKDMPGDRIDFALLAGRMAVIDRRRGGVGITAADERQLKAALHQSNHPTLACALRLLFPSFKARHQHMLFPDGVKARLDESRQQGIARFAEDASDIHILFPALELSLDESDWQEMQKAAQTARARNDWLTFTSLASSIRVLDATRSPLVSAEDWQELNRFVRSDRVRTSPDPRLPITGLIRALYSMAILAADEVRITNRGLELIRNDSRNQVSPPIPESSML